MSKKIDMKSKKERFMNQKRERTRVQKHEESKASNAMIIWLVLAFVAVAVLVGYLVWQASSESQQTETTVTNSETQKKSDDNTTNTSDRADQASKKEETVKKEETAKKIPISDKPLPKKKFENGFPTYDFAPPMKIDVEKKYEATLKTNRGNIKITLFPKDAPIAVNNFVFLARDNYYNGVTFHRIIKDFMVQAGDPQGTGFGGPGYTIDDEFSFAHDYERGIVAMAKSREPNSAGSQFFIGTGPQVENLGEQRDYIIFGKVKDGYDVLDDIADTPVKANSQNGSEVSVPTEKIIINSIDIKES